VFSYYGRKARVARLYPAPSASTVVEPFAGSIAYSERWLPLIDRVIAVEADTGVSDLLRRVIAMTPDDIAALPDLHVGEVTADPLHIVMTASKRWWTFRKITTTPIMVTNWNLARRRWARNAAHFSKIEVVEGDYRDAPRLDDATYFVDPPYRGEPGTGYRFGSGSVDYAALAAWCRDLPGQVIVCEGAGADWLPFEPLTSTHVGVGGKLNTEMVWLNDGDHGRLL